VRRNGGREVAIQFRISAAPSPARRHPCSTVFSDDVFLGRPRQCIEAFRLIRAPAAPFKIGIGSGNDFIIIAS